jgi:hypothetical protein
VGISAEVVSCWHCNNLLVDSHAPELAISFRRKGLAQYSATLTTRYNAGQAKEESIFNSSPA